MFAIGSDVRARGATTAFGLGLALLATSCGRPLAPGELPRGDASAADAGLDVRIMPPPPDAILALPDAYLPPSGHCGDGVLDLGEQCDDGNRTAGDGCTALCQLLDQAVCPVPGQPCHFVPTCGDGVVFATEACDDGNVASGDGCAADCTAVEPGWRCLVPGRRCVPICGDGVLMGSETCEDANTVDGDGCSSTCLVEPGCDGGASCEVPHCGDGIASGAEECDEASPSDGGLYGGCTPRCRYGEFCGDGVVNGPEECDLGTFSNSGRYGDKGGCTTGCLNAHYCGDGIVDAATGEQCDQGADNGTAGAFCSTHCKIYLL